MKESTIVLIGLAAIIILGIGFTAYGNYATDKLMPECVQEGELTKFECKALAHQMVWGN